MIKNKEKRERRKKTVPIWIGILVFIGAFIIGILSKLLIQPSWMADYSMKWSEKIGTKCKLRSNGMPVPLLRNGYSIFNGTKYR